jgi:hypothetical protein
MSLNVPKYYHMDQVHYIRADVAFNTPGIGGTTGIVIGMVPAGARIVDVVVTIDTAFNAATTNVLTVGDSGNVQRLATNTETVPGTTGGKRAALSTGLGYRYPSDTQVIVRYTQTGTAATAGAAHVMVAYTVAN